MAGVADAGGVHGKTMRLRSGAKSLLPDR
jgi:hypothetical protein